MVIRENVNQNERLSNFTLIAKEQQFYSCSTFQSKFGSYNSGFRICFCFENWPIRNRNCLCWINMKW